MSRKAQQTIETTVIQLATVDMVLKVSGYVQSVIGHGKQHLMVAVSAVHKRPSMSKSWSTNTPTC